MTFVKQMQAIICKLQALTNHLGGDTLEPLFAIAAAICCRMLGTDFRALKLPLPLAFAPAALKPDSAASCCRILGTARPVDPARPEPSPTGGERLRLVGPMWRVAAEPLVGDGEVARTAPGEGRWRSTEPAACARPLWCEPLRC